MTTAAPGGFTVRVAVPDVWDHVTLPADGTTTVADLKRAALARTLGTGPAADPATFIVKYHGGQVLDESVTLQALGVRPNAPLIVLPARRRPVR